MDKQTEQIHKGNVANPNPRGEWEGAGCGGAGWERQIAAADSPRFSDEKNRCQLATIRTSQPCTLYLCP